MLAQAKQAGHAGHSTLEHALLPLQLEGWPPIWQGTRVPPHGGPWQVDATATQTQQQSLTFTNIGWDLGRICAVTTTLAALIGPATDMMIL